MYVCLFLFVYSVVYIQGSQKSKLLVVHFCEIMMLNAKYRVIFGASYVMRDY